MAAFIRAFGKRFDGDPRLAYVTAGLLGTWGEWHTYPRNDLWASMETQAVVLDEYARAFRMTPILLRYPAGHGHYAQAENASRPFGYHDDSFAWATLDTGRTEDNWFYMPALQAAGQMAIQKWKKHPIGGEIRPELWGKIFDSKDRWPSNAQDFETCVAETHATWLMDTGMFREKASPERLQNANTSVRKMGYDLYVRRVKFRRIPDGDVQIDLELINQGVAPFYADWPTELTLMDGQGNRFQTRSIDSLSVKGLLPLPSGQAHRLSATIRLPIGQTAKALIRIVNPLTDGKPVRFANAEQDNDEPGWLTLGTILN